MWRLFSFSFFASSQSQSSAGHFLCPHTCSLRERGRVISVWPNLNRSKFTRGNKVSIWTGLTRIYLDLVSCTCNFSNGSGDVAVPPSSPPPKRQKCHVNRNLSVGAHFHNHPLSLYIPGRQSGPTPFASQSQQKPWAPDDAIASRH